MPIGQRNAVIAAFAAFPEQDQQRFIAGFSAHDAQARTRNGNRRVETINSYYSLNMDLLNPDCRRALFGTHPVYTKVHDEVPARYMEGAHAANSLVADGCVIEGTVENSILFRGVRVGKGAHIKNSILMQGDTIEAGVEIEHVILDKDVTVLSGSRLIAPKLYPIVVGKSKTV